MRFGRRNLLQLAASAAAFRIGSPLAALAAPPPGTASDEFFVFVHASGGWDVTLWADPRNEKRGLVSPASTDNTDVSGLRLWKDAPAMEGGARSFELVKGKNGAVFGPGIGDLAEIFERVTLVNGLAMNTVSHPDGSSFSVTGRHLVGGHAPASSVDTAVANELGKEQLLPAVSVQFPSSYVGENLDRRAVPLALGQIGSLSRSLMRPGLYEDDAERDAVTATLSEEARDLAARSAYPNVPMGLALQYDGLRHILGSKLQDAFSEAGLQKAYPNLPYKSRFVGGAATNVAFALEAAKRNVTRCMSFSIPGFDTHGQNYKTHAMLLQETNDLLTKLVRELDATPHPTRTGKKLADHTHILVVSDFCRTPQINLTGGRDHYPNNSSVVISPRFKGGVVVGRSDVEQLLPAPVRKFVDAERAVSPPDVLATFLQAMGIDPRRYMRDGEAMPELLRA